jgi:PII-like signaling protein
MAERFEGERTLMRIFLGESDRCPSGPHRGLPLYEAILLTLRERGCAGATVTRAVAGFGASARLHTDKVLRLSSDLPMIVEVVDDEENLRHLLPEIDTLMGGGLITLESVHVVMYRGQARPS